MTAQIGTKEIVDKALEILKADARVKDLFTWYRGRRSLHDVQQFPAASVYRGDGEARGASIPSGMEAVVAVEILLRWQGEKPIDELEQDMESGTDKIVEVLWDNRKLGLSRVGWFSLTWTSRSNPEAAPGFAESLVSLRVTVRV